MENSVSFVLLPSQLNLEISMQRLANHNRARLVLKS